MCQLYMMVFEVLSYYPCLLYFSPPHPSLPLLLLAWLPTPNLNPTLTQYSVLPPSTPTPSSHLFLTPNSPTYYLRPLRPALNTTSLVIPIPRRTSRVFTQPVACFDVACCAGRVGG